MSLKDRAAIGIGLALPQGLRTGRSLNAKVQATDATEQGAVRFYRPANHYSLPSRA